MRHAKTSYVCLSCRSSFKQPFLGEPERRCPGCGQPLRHAGSAFAAPPRRDTNAWRVLAVLLNAGVGFHKSCCSGPGFRPRTPREVRERLAHARATGMPPARALQGPAPATAIPGTLRRPSSTMPKSTMPKSTMPEPTMPASATARRTAPRR